MIDAMGREYAKKRPYRSEPELALLEATVHANLERHGIKFRVDGEPYQPVLPCAECDRVTLHTFAGEVEGDEDPNFKYQQYACEVCGLVRVWGCEGEGEGE